MSRVLLIRPLQDALPLARILKAKGLQPRLYPLFKPHFLPLPPLTNIQGLIITSKNALRAVRKHHDLMAIPLYVVGDETARLARLIGFTHVLSASGTSQDLINLILQHAHREGGIFWHLSGESIRGRILKSLRDIGFQAERHIVYQIKDSKDIPPSLCVELQNQHISYAFFFSPRTTKVFANLLKKRGLEKVTRQMTSLCLSKEVAKEAMAFEWKKIWVSPQPTLESLIGYFNEKN